MAILTGGLQQVRVLFPDNTVQTATLRTWTIGLTVSQTLFNGFKTANTVRQSEAKVQSGREALRNTGQGVLLDAVIAYTNVLANQSLVEAQRVNVTFLRETLGTTKKRLDAGDVTPTDVAQAEARLSRGQADLNAAEVNYAISQAIYAQVIGAAPGRLAVAEPIDRLLPRTARRRWRSAARIIPPFSPRCTTPTWPSSAPRSPKAACGPTSRCRAASSANGRTTRRSAPRATISPRSSHGCSSKSWEL